MYVLSIGLDPINRIVYESVSTKRVVVIEQLKALKATVTGLPNELNAILFTGDLQGRAVRPSDGSPGRLLGDLLAEELTVLASHGAIPALDRVGAVLVGDRYAQPEMDKRGGTGEVRSVWKGFADCCRWLVGVAAHQRGAGRRTDTTTNRYWSGNAHAPPENSTSHILSIAAHGAISLCPPTALPAS